MRLEVLYMSEKKETKNVFEKLFGGMDVEARFGLMRMADRKSVV